jgi:hypothetical protein
VDPPPREGVHDLDRVVPQGGDDDALPLGIDGEGIEPSVHARQGDFLDQPQRGRLPLRTVLGLSDAGHGDQSKGTQDGEAKEARSTHARLQIIKEKERSLDGFTA